MKFGFAGGGATEVAIDIVARDHASAVLNKVAGTAESAGGRFDKWKGRAQVAAVAAGAAIAKFGIDSMKAFAGAEASQRVLEDAYARFPAVQDVPIQKMREYAQALQAKTKFDGDEINAMQGKLAAYKLTGTQIQQLTPLVLDYAAKTGKDLKTASDDVGKAIMGQGRALKVLGINFKDAGSPAANFEQLMGGLRTQVGGFAEKEGASAEGRLAILGNKFGDLQESIGQKLMPAATALTDWLIKAVDWISQNSTWLGALGATVLTVVGAVKAWTIAQGLLNFVLLANPITLVVTAVAALAAGIVWVATQTKFFQSAWGVMTSAIGGWWRGLWNGILAPIIRFILNGFAMLAASIGTFLVALGKIPGFGWADTAGQKMLGAAGKARDLAKNIRDIPDTSVTDIKLNGAEAAKARAESLARALRLIPNVNRTVFINTVNTAARGVSYGVQERAGGGRYKAGPLLVGERGPELQFPDEGGYVVDAADTARLLAAAGRGGGRRVAGDGGDVHVTAVLQLDGREVHRSLLKVKREDGRGLDLE